MRAALALTALVGLALSLSAAAPAKGFTRVVLVAADGRWVEVRAAETTIDGLLSRRGRIERPRGGYLRLFFTGTGDFPANPGRYYPERPCVALDWPRYETTCRRVSTTLLRAAHRLARFWLRPTVLTRITSPDPQTAVSLLRSPLELAFARRGRGAPQPARCYSFAGRWRGAAAALRPRSFLVCKNGAYAEGRLHPLGRGVFEWLRLNVGPPAPS